VSTDAALLQEIKDNFQYGQTFWKDTRDEGQRDMRAVAGDPWNPDERDWREKAKRPVLSLDELSQYLNQLINGVRQHPRAIKVTPRGNGADDQTAELRANKIREIEYRSHAQEAYTTMLEDAAQRSYGAMHIKTEYENERSFNKEITIEPIVNPDQITIDPFALRSTASDMKWAFQHETRKKAEFIRTYGKDAALPNLLDSDASEKLWMPDAESVNVANYWKIKTRPRTLLQVVPEQTAQPSSIFGLNQRPIGDLILFEDELPKRMQEQGIRIKEITQTRKVDYPSVCCYLTNGMDILKESAFPGTMIPIVMCYGKILYLDDGTGTKRHILSMIRLARDPYMLYCYYRTQQAEMAGMIPKAPVMAYKGQFRGIEHDWQKANHEPVAFLEANPTTEETGSQVLPLPTRLAYEAGAHLQALELCAEGARRAIQAAIGSSPLPSQAQRKNEKSGKALQIIDEAQQLGSFHFIDHYDDSLMQGGRIINGIMNEVYDTVRELAVHDVEGKASTIRINDPNYTNEQGQPEHVRMDAGEHEITISTGPKQDSERERNDEFISNLVESPLLAQYGGPKIGAAVLATSIKLGNFGILGDKLYDLIMPAEYKEGGDKLDPIALQQRVKELEQIAQEADALLKMAEEEKKARTVEAQSKERIAADGNAVKLTIEEMKADAKGKEIAQQGAIDVRMQRMEDQIKLLLATMNANLKRDEMEHQAEQAERADDKEAYHAAREEQREAREDRKPS
jgi:hypothetical protein